MPHADEITVFVEHGNVLIGAGLIAVLRKQGGFTPVECQSGWAVEAGPKLYRTARSVVIADYETGLRHIESANAGRHRVVILTHRDSEAEIGRALECGAQGGEAH